MRFVVLGTSGFSSLCLLVVVPFVSLLFGSVVKPKP